MAERDFGVQDTPPRPAAPADASATGPARVDPGLRAEEPPLLPDTTADERDVGWGEAPERDDDERYLREVPPHHGG